MSPNTVVISANPKSGKSSGLARAQSLQASLQNDGFACELFTDIAAMTQRVRELHACGELKTVVSAGGDGTASLISNCVPNEVPITLFPLGSENLLARYFGITDDSNQICAIIRSGRRQSVDQFQVANQKLLLVASVGFDAQVVRYVHQNRVSHITRWNYWKAILHSITTYAWPEFQVDLLDEQGDCFESLTANWLFAFNVPRYAAGIEIIREAVIDDGKLEIGLFSGGGLARGMYHYECVRRGTHTKLPSWKRKQASGLRVVSLPRSTSHSNLAIPYQIDGDDGGDLPLCIQCCPEKLTLLIPEAR